ncbi:hypothetical protein [Sporomusa sp.]|uniref:hypothetical protein n=1 Tax=Sporomusa sp. TaxID=2078658 RepID=UPI002D193F23|nr:hypothetical protein [Sporomusa sp.]HWR44255.1 hypothetical protein [Sporomusa sp.]
MSQDVEIKRFRFFVLPNNTTGSVSIPITRSPATTTLASLTRRSDCDSDSAVLLSATVGWVAITDGTGLDRVDVLFKIWRGAPVTGTLIFSADDSGESGFDSRKVTSFSHVDTRFDFRSSKPPTYFLTAELPDTGSVATVIGPITFTATEFEI